jgi:hypothetical protein
MNTQFTSNLGGFLEHSRDLLDVAIGPGPLHIAKRGSGLFSALTECYTVPWNYPHKVILVPLEIDEYG